MYVYVYIHIYIYLRERGRDCVVPLQRLGTEGDATQPEEAAEVWPGCFISLALALGSTAMQGMLFMCSRGELSSFFDPVWTGGLGPSGQSFQTP